MIRATYQGKEEIKFRPVYYDYKSLIDAGIN